ncbi:uncharacterized protein A4U43_C01F34640 [Asparagus officinalis]|uniref:Uncharacterized protein n=1 Tax=Asparagus officinalis TaxID=4686 RepID=A0A5P1FUG2_ASPOF|nr:uncharacterized protein A4U43_C01F34640 [Asparagus officinalis]
MDDAKIIDSLDSLWFSSNVLLSPSPKPTEAAPQLQPVAQPVDPNPTESPPEISADPSEAMKEPEISPVKKKRSDDDGDGTRRRKPNEFHKEEMISMASTLTKHQNYCCNYRCGANAAGDDLAMKEQLRSWARAVVACTVE